MVFCSCPSRFGVQSNRQQSSPAGKRWSSQTIRSKGKVLEWVFSSRHFKLIVHFPGQIWTSLTGLLGVILGKESDGEKRGQRLLQYICCFCPRSLRAVRRLCECIKRLLLLYESQLRTIRLLGKKERCDLFGQSFGAFSLYIQFLSSPLGVRPRNKKEIAESQVCGCWLN
jgi:hypothetical protein